MHTPSTPKVNSPASATDPRYSTSGILNAQTKERNRQGLLSTYGGRTGQDIDINKFADAKINMRNPSAVSALESLSKLYSNVAQAGNQKGVGYGKTGASKATARINEYNKNVDAVNNYLSNYGTKDKNIVKAQDARITGTVGRATNKREVGNYLNNMGSSSEVFNEVAENIKKQKQPAKQ